jgi:hypothetical protein
MIGASDRQRVPAVARASFTASTQSLCICCSSLKTVRAGDGFPADSLAVYDSQRKQCLDIPLFPGAGTCRQRTHVLLKDRDDRLEAARLRRDGQVCALLRQGAWIQDLQCQLADPDMMAPWELERRVPDVVRVRPDLLMASWYSGSPARIGCSRSIRQVADCGSFLQAGEPTERREQMLVAGIFRHPRAVCPVGLVTGALVSAVVPCPKLAGGH